MTVTCLSHLGLQGLTEEERGQRRLYSTRLEIVRLTSWEQTRCRGGGFAVAVTSSTRLSGEGSIFESHFDANSGRCVCVWGETLGPRAGTLVPPADGVTEFSSELSENVRDCDKDEVSGPLGGQALGSQEWRPVTTRSFGVWWWLCAPPRDS